MTGNELASTLRRAAEATEKIFGSSQINNRKADLAMLSEESAVGAALMLTYLRDCFTVTPKENFDRPTLLVMLHAIASDPEIFPNAIGLIVWDQVEESEDEVEAKAL